MIVTERGLDCWVGQNRNLTQLSKKAKRDTDTCPRNVGLVAWSQWKGGVAD